jgi:tetratricopeptide (TPR) repeat protein
LKDYEGAIDALKRAVDLNPNLIKAHAGLAQAYQRTHKVADAGRESDRVAVLTAQQRDRGRAMIDVQSAVQQLKSGRTADALSTLQSAIEASPDFPDTYLELGRAIRESKGDTNAAIAAFRRVLNLDPERAEAHYEIGLTLEGAGRKAEALPEYRIAVEMAPCNAEARRALGQASSEAGQWSIAEAQYRAVIALLPQDERATRQFELAVSKQTTTQ